MKDRSMLFIQVRSSTVKVALSLIFIWLFVPTVLANPFELKNNLAHEVEAYRCHYQKADALLKAIKVVKPTGCKAVASPGGDSIIYTCKTLSKLQELSSIIKRADTHNQPVKIKVYWVVIQAHKAKNLLNILDGRDCNSQTLWRMLLKDYINEGLAQTLACPEVTAIAGRPFFFKTQERFQQTFEVSKSRRVVKKKVVSSDIELSMKGGFSVMANDKYLLNLDLKHETQLTDHRESPQSQQSLKTDLVVELGKVFPVGGVYNVKVHEQKQGSLLSSITPWAPSLYTAIDKRQDFVSTVFVELV